ncbi:MAG: type II toxin-antitoxin system mRNA interferase toxin, RelE/StbE family, partial [Elusimicrobia bacterium CG08_land_8_20_14_0_20_44_26]
MAHSVLKVHSTSGFEKSFRKLPVHIQELAEKKDKWFRKNVLDIRLHTHKLKGELVGYWSYYINRRYRILFRFISIDEVIYYDIGTHEIY